MRELSNFLESCDWDPLVLTLLAIAAVLYALGLRELGRRAQGRSVMASWRPWCFAGGLAAVWLALLSPIAEYDDVLLFMHMIQHLLLILVAAPLILLGAPLLPVLWALPRDARGGLGKLFAPGPVHTLFSALTHPLTAVSVYCATLAVWHIPLFFDAAEGRTVVHYLEHAWFLGTALLLWWPVIHPAGGRRRLGYAAGVIYFLPPMLIGSLIGALFTFAGHPLYTTYQDAPGTWGISPLQDQQLAGLIMWVPGGLVFLVPVSIFLGLLLSGSSGEDAGKPRETDADGLPPGMGETE